MFLDLADLDWDPKWLVFATSANYMLHVCYFLYAFIISIVHINYRPNRKDTSMEMGQYGYDNKLSHQDQGSNDEDSDSQVSSPLHIKFFWLFYINSLASCTTVVVAYWTILFEGFDETAFQKYLQVDRHGINLLLLIIEFIFNKMPFRLLHAIYSVIFTLVYLIVNVTYTLVADDLVYKAADWINKPGVALAMFLGLLFATAFFHTCWFFINKLKRKCCK